MNKPAPTDHHEHGPSNLPMWRDCARFTSESAVDIDDLEAAALPDEGEAEDDDTVEKQKSAKVEIANRAAQRGRAQHASLADTLNGNTNSFADLSDLEEVQVRWTAETILKKVNESGYSSSDIEVEQRVTRFKGGSFEEDYFGTLDVRWGPNIADAKFGEIRDYFPQLAGYSIPEMDLLEVGQIRAFAIYARYRRTKEYLIKRDTAELVVDGILRRRRNPLTPPTPCQYCGWCKHKLTCSAINETVAIVVDRRDDWRMKLPVDISKANDPVTLGAMRYIWMSYLKPWGKALEYATSMLGAADIVPTGFRIREQFARAKFHNMAAAFLAMKKLGISDSKIVEASSLSVEKLAKAYKESHGGSEKAAKQEVLTALLEAEAITRDRTSVLIKEENAEDEIRLALAERVSSHARLE